MNLAFLVHLPDHAERFEPVARLLPGSDLLLGGGRWAPARRDSRALTRRWLRRRGWTALEQPHPRFDLILASACSAPAAVASWLAPGGRVVLWHESWCRSRFFHALGPSGLTNDPSSQWVLDPVVSRLCAGWDDEIATLGCDRAEVTGDPRWDALVDPAAASRARTALGIDRDRPVTLLLAEQFLLRPEWASALAALRSESELVLRLTTPGWLEMRGEWPRAWTGPGLRLSEPDDGVGLAELLALADLVIAPPGVYAHAAVMAGKRTLLVAEGWSALRNEAALRVTSDGMVGDRLACVDPSDLRAACERALRAPAPPRHSLLDGRAAARLAAVVAELTERPNASASALRS